jgi:hypothetical protein
MAKLFRYYSPSLKIIGLILIFLMPVAYSKPSLELKVDRKKGVMSIKATNQPLSKILEMLNDQEGIKVEVAEFTERNVTASISKQPIARVLEQLLGGDARYSITSHRGDLIIPGLSGNKTGLQTKPNLTLPPKKSSKDRKLDAGPISGDLKPQPDNVKLVESKTGNGTKASPIETKPDSLNRSKIKSKELIPVQGRYARIRFKMENDSIRVESAEILPGAYINPISVPSDYVYSIVWDDTIIAVGSFIDPLEKHTYFPEEDRPHQELRAKTGYFSIDLPESLLVDNNLRNSRIEIFRFSGTSPTNILSPKTFPQFIKGLRSIKSIRGIEISGRLEDRTQSRGEENDE